VERSGRSTDCIVQTEVTRGDKDADVNIRPPEDNFDTKHDISSMPPDITGLDNYKTTGGFDSPHIPISMYEYGKNADGGYEIPKNPPPNLLNDYVGPDKQEYGQESERSHGSSTSMRRQESYDHQEYTHEKTRKLPGWRSGWGEGEAPEDPRWKIKYDTSANEINEINEVNRSGHFTGNLLMAFLFEMFLVYVIH
jgi:hypothetical protein